MIKIRGLRQLARNRSGASAVEFALVGPLFFLVLFGAMQVGIALFNYNSLENALAAGARHLSLNESDEIGAKSVARETAIASYLNPERVVINTQHGSAPYKHIEIRGTYTFRMVGPPFFEEGIDLNASVLVPISK